MRIDTVIDLGWGSSGKGNIAGHLALKNQYEAVVCAYGTQAGHTAKAKRAGVDVLVQQLPVGIINPSVKTVFIGPGALIHEATMMGEIERYAQYLKGKRLVIHPHAAVVTDEHSKAEYAGGYTKIGSTGKGVGKAMIERIERNPENPNVAGIRFRGGPLGEFLVSRMEYMHLMDAVEGNMLMEGAQGFGLSLYHGDYPYCTSRDVTTAQLVADCALPWHCVGNVNVVGVTRTYPIRVSNRDGFSGPAYPSQRETSFEEIGREVERTTVTKLPRRIFEFSREQIYHAAEYCLDGNSSVALTFADYCRDIEHLTDIMAGITMASGNPVRFVSFGPDSLDDVIDVMECSKGEFIYKAQRALGV